MEEHSLDLIQMQGLNIPVPCDWEKSDELNYFGENGLLDIRLSENREPFSNERLERVLEIFRKKDNQATVALCLVQNRQALDCRYQVNGNLVQTFTIKLSEAKELTAVYVMRPHAVALIPSIQKIFIDTPTIRGE